MVSNADNIIVPDERQIRVLEDIRARVASRWPTTELKHEQHFQHWEDPSLDVPPLGESCWFMVNLPVLELTIGTPLPWDASPRSRLRVSFSSYDSGQHGEPWALVLDAAARTQLADAGIEPGKQGRSWSLDERSERDVADSMVETITRLSAVSIRVLRRADLPADVEWPWHGLVNLMTADQIVSIDAQPNGSHLVTFETAGRRTTAEVGPKDMQLVNWWWARTRPKLYSDKERG